MLIKYIQVYYRQTKKNLHSHPGIDDESHLGPPLGDHECLKLNGDYDDTVRHFCLNQSGGFTDILNLQREQR